MLLAQLTMFISFVRSTPLKLLLRLSTSLITQALRSKLDPDILSNGVSYFTSPLLNWTLFNVVRGVLKESESSKWVPFPICDVLSLFIFISVGLWIRPSLISCRRLFFRLLVLVQYFCYAKINCIVSLPWNGPKVSLLSMRLRSETN